MSGGCASLHDAVCHRTVCKRFSSCQAEAVPDLDAARSAVFWARQQERAGYDQCVESYFQAATLAQGLLRAEAVALESADPATKARSIYHDAIAGLIRTAQQFGRYDPWHGIRVETEHGPQVLPISFHGFAWGPGDFSRLVIADASVATDLKVQYFRPGIGVPLIVVREKGTCERFHAPRSHFPATANLKCYCPNEAGSRPEWTLELANPCVVECTEFEGRPTVLAADFSASTRYTVDREPRAYLTGFLSPGTSTAEAKLILLEPYQPGKIPVVFIHGLLSDPMTWAELYDTCKIDPELHDRYQFWAFQYPTGAAFFQSAAILRRELATVVACCDPGREDSALSQIVLVGHSMGGLLAKLQITSSGDRLWQSLASRPLETVQASPPMRAELQSLFYFEPSAHVRRVVFIGTPHNGSGWANRLVGRVGSCLVRIPTEEEREYETFLRANPGLVDKFAARRIPTSVDLLEPGNVVLAAMARLPLAPDVTMNSIIGTGGCQFWGAPSDGVVPVASARISGVESECYVGEGHEDLHRAPETCREVVRILHRHLNSFDRHP